MFDQHGFPVKLSIPLAYSMQAKVQLNVFSFLDSSKANTSKFLPPNCSDFNEIFTIPTELEKVSRKEGMKTLKNKSKRLAFANLNIS